MAMLLYQTDKTSEGLFQHNDRFDYIQNPVRNRFCH
jgi:hypothetical protein